MKRFKRERVIAWTSAAVVLILWLVLVGKLLLLATA